MAPVVGWFRVVQGGSDFSEGGPGPARPALPPEVPKTTSQPGKRGRAHAYAAKSGGELSG